MKKRSALKVLRAQTLIEYVLILACVSMAAVVFGPPLMKASEKQDAEIRSEIVNEGGGGATSMQSLSGTVSIDVARVGATSHATVTGLPGGAVARYTWHVGSSIVKTGSSTYSPSSSEIGGRLWVSVTDGSGTYAGAIESGRIQITQSGMSGTVEITPPMVGVACTATITGAPSGAQAAYTWYVDGEAAGTGATYTPTASQEGKQIWCSVKDSTGANAGEVRSDAATVGRAAMAGWISYGAPRVGVELTATVTGAPSDANVRIEWFADGSKAASGPKFTPAPEHNGKQIWAVATDASGKYAGEVAGEKKTVGANALTGSLSFDAPIVGNEVRASATGAPADAKLSYTWYVDNQQAATGETFTPQSSQEGASLRVEARDASGLYTGTIASGSQGISRRALTGSISIRSSKIGQAWHAEASGLPSDCTPAYTWYVSGQQVGTGTSWTPDSSYAGKSATVRVSDASARYSGYIDSDPVAISLEPAEGSVAIGDAYVAQAVRASVSGTPSGFSPRYVWYIVEGTDATVIEGATGSTYTPSVSDYGKQIRVQVYDGSGRYEGVLTSAVKTVRRRRLTGSVTIGSPVVGTTCRASVSGLPSSPSAKLKYQWYAAGSPVSSSSSWTPTRYYAGDSLYCRVSDTSGVYEGYIQSSPKTIAQPAMTGTVSIGVSGDKLTATVLGKPSNATVRYQWYSGSSAISGATSRTFNAASYHGKRIRCRVTASGYTGYIQSAYMDWNTSTNKWY